MSFDSACKELAENCTNCSSKTNSFKFFKFDSYIRRLFHGLSRMLKTENVNNDVSKDSPIGYCFLTHMAAKLFHSIYLRLLLSG